MYSFILSRPASFDFQKKKISTTNGDNVANKTLVVDIVLTTIHSGSSQPLAEEFVRF